MNTIFQFEIRHWLKSPLFYFFGISFFLFALVMMLGTGGYFDGVVDTGEKIRQLNTPFELTFISQFFVKLLLFPAAIFMGNSIFRDFKSKTHSILYTYPISKSYYLLAKLGSSLLMTILICLAMYVAIFIGEMMLGLDNPKIGEMNPMAYVTAVGIYLIPTIIVVSLLVFTTVGATRNIFAGFITVIILFLFQTIVNNIFFNHTFLLGLLDPFGQNAFNITTQDWNLDIQNSNMIPVDYLVVINRIFWMFLASLYFSVFYKKFDFQFNNNWEWKRKKQENHIKAGTSKLSKGKDSMIKFDFSSFGQLKSLFYLIKYDYLGIAKNWMFLLLTVFGVLTIFFIQLRVTNTGEFNLLPKTRLLLSAPLSIYSIIILVATFLFSGMLVHKAKNNNMDSLVNVSPVNTWHLFISKIGAISLIQISFLILFMFCGLIIQLYNSYYQFEMDLYFFQLFILIFPVLFIWNVTSVFVHTVVPNLFLGLFFLISLWMGVDFLEQVGIQTSLLAFNKLPSLVYSDFNGFGFQLKGYFLLMGYWFVLSIILIMITYLFWNRGTIASVKERLVWANSRLNKTILGILFLLITNFSWLGIQIFQGEQLDVFSNVTAEEMNSFKSKWEKYDKIAQPKIMNIDLNIDIHPSRNEFSANGHYLLINDTKESIDTILIRTGFDEQTELNWNGKAISLEKDSFFKYNSYQLKEPLLPNDSIKLDFVINSIDNTIFTRNSNVLENGTFIKHDVLPRLAYQFSESELLLSDSTNGMYNYFTKDADLLNIRTRISTSNQQIAIAPGKLIIEKKEGTRNYYEYKTEHPVKFNFSFHSAQFETIKEKYNGVRIELYHYPSHKENATFMMDGIKASLDYNTKRFGAYPYDEIRVVEFPHTEENYSATLTANNIPTSEIMFNINTKAMEGKLNLPFYVMAHELTHEWFGNTVMPAASEGAKMLTESMTEYITLCIYRESLGNQLADEFLKLQHQRYWNGRRKELKKENPLYKVQSHQEYISYGKGAMVFNALAHKIGSDKMNEILLQYLNLFKGHPESYPNSMDFIELMKSLTPFKYHAEINDLMMTTNYYDNELISIEPKGSNQVEVSIGIQKFDGNTNERIEVVNEMVEIGQLNELNEWIRRDTLQVNSGENNFTLNCLDETTNFVLDPFLLKIDKELRGNVFELR